MRAITSSTRNSAPPHRRLPWIPRSCKLRVVGKVTLASVALALAMAAATLRLPPPLWMVALYAALVVAFVAFTCATGWFAASRLRSEEMPRSWALVPGLVGLSAIVASYVLSVGPGGSPEAPQVTIDLSRWMVSSAGVAGAISCFGFGAYLVPSRARLAHAGGVALIGAGLLSLQPVLKALGLPYLGPAGALAALLVFVVGAALGAVRRS